MAVCLPKRRFRAEARDMQRNLKLAVMPHAVGKEWKRSIDLDSSQHRGFLAGTFVSPFLTSHDIVLARGWSDRQYRRRPGSARLLSVFTYLIAACRSAMPIRLSVIIEYDKGRYHT